MTDYKNELDLATHFANCIGSPWGEGATYDKNRGAEAKDEYTKENGNYSHLDDEDFENFRNDLAVAIQALLSQHSKKRELEARKDENEYWCEMSKTFQRGMLKGDFKDRINQLTNGEGK